MDAPDPKSEAREAHQTLIESLISRGSAVFDPSTPDRKAAQVQLANLINGTRTAAILPALNFLIQPSRVPDVLREEFISWLAKIPMRNDGVRGTLEFVFSVHPSSAGDAAAPQKDGASITHEALKMATQLLASPPANMEADAWFVSIAPQLLALLDGHDGLELAKVAAYVIGFGILGRKKFGAPGTQGWRSFAEPMLKSIDPLTSETPIRRTETRSSDDDVVDLRNSAAKILVLPEEVAQGLRRLQTLIISHPNPGLTRRLLGPIVLPLWALSSWPNASKEGEEEYCLPARNLLKIYLKITTSADKILPIVRDLLFEGGSDAQKRPFWRYQATGPGDASRICIVTASGNTPNATEVLQSRWSEIGPKSDALLDLFASISTDDEDISSIFLDLFSRWLASRRPKQNQAKTGIILTRDEKEEQDESSGSNPLAEVLEGTILQKMMGKFPDKLVGRPDDILELMGGLLGQLDQATPLTVEDESVPIMLSLLNMVVTSPGFRKAKADAIVVQSIESSLTKISAWSGTDSAEETAKTAKNLLLFLKYRDEIEDPESESATHASAGSAVAKQQVEDRKTYNLALSYITQADSPPPVRSEGLNLLQGLIQANSAILDIPGLLVLLSSLLDENEDYVNLRVIKIFTLLADRHPKSTTKELLDNYVDAAETKRVDTRLRFGEALLQVVQRLGATFAGDIAQQVGQALLETAGRRGHRPKTEAKQAREERMLALKDKKKAQGGDIDDDDDIDVDEALLSDEEKQRNAILGRIVEGWGSKRGSEDVRVRASALSILATGIDTNIAGLGAVLASGTVDLCLHVLTMEPEPEKAILRRAAIVLILSFVRALDDARQQRRRLGFGLTQQSQDNILRILRYVAGTDEDGLVKQHALDVIESLENWQISSLLSSASDGDDVSAGPLGGLTQLAGLSLDPASLNASGPSSVNNVNTTKRPRIEEIE